MEPRIQYAQTKVKYTRLYADNQGISHFGDLEFELSEADIAPPSAQLNVSAPFAVTQCLFASVPQNWDGGVVNLAARIAARAGGGEILASDVVRQMVAGKRFLFTDRGESALRGFEDAVRLYEVAWRESR